MSVSRGRRRTFPGSTSSFGAVVNLPQLWIPAHNAAEKEQT